LTRGGVPATSPAELEWDLQYLVTLGARFLTFENILAGDFPGPEEFGIVISFDDCFADNYTTGRSILDKFGIKAVFFQTTGLIDRQTLLWEHQLYWYGRQPDMLARLWEIANSVLTNVGRSRIDNPDEVIAELRDATPFRIVTAILEEAEKDRLLKINDEDLPVGLYPQSGQLRETRGLGHEIGCHGHQHLRRTMIDKETFKADLEQARESIATLLEEPPRSYSFPFSSYLPGDDAICKDVAFEIAATVSQCSDFDSPIPYLVPRCTWPGPARNRLRQRRWLLTGGI